MTIQHNSYTGDMLIFSAMSTYRPLKIHLLVLVKDLHIKENENKTLIIYRSIDGILGDLKSTNYDLAEYRSLLKLKLYKSPCAFWPRLSKTFCCKNRKEHCFLLGEYLHACSFGAHLELLNTLKHIIQISLGIS